MTKASNTFFALERTMAEWNDESECQDLVGGSACQTLFRRGGDEGDVGRMAPMALPIRRRHF